MSGGYSESFDPRTWDLGLQAHPASASSPKAGAGLLASIARGENRMALAIGVSLLVIVAGGVAALMSQTSEAPTQGDVVVSDDAVGIPARPAPEPLRDGEARRTLVLASVTDLAPALVAYGIESADAALAQAAAAGAIVAGGELRAELTLADTDGRKTISRLEVSNPDGSGVVVTPGAGGRYAAEQLAAQLVQRVVVRSGRMDADSFYSSAVAAGITDSLIPVFAAALAFDFDFQREVGVGDAFEAAFSQDFNAQGDPVGPPDLLYASLTTAAKSAAVYHFDGAPEGGQWFDGSGRSIVRSLMRTPVDGARVSSRFGFRRHPILGFQKLHRGTDFAAPTGTPIFASGNAVVTWSGMKGANGNLVVLRHDNGWQTYYLHQDRILPQVTVGARVMQGQHIGDVGTTGRSTGPHLHYEVHIGNAPVDPQTIQVDEGKTLSGSQLIAFGKVRDRIDLSRATPSQ